MKTEDTEWLDCLNLRKQHAECWWQSLLWNNQKLFQDRLDQTWKELNIEFKKIKFSTKDSLFRGNNKSQIS